LSLFVLDPVIAKQMRHSQELDLHGILLKEKAGEIDR
jgi:hypothetical protein